MHDHDRFYPSELQLIVRPDSNDGLEVVTTPACEVASQLLQRTIADEENQGLNQIGLALQSDLKIDHELTVKIDWEPLEVPAGLPPIYLARIHLAEQEGEKPKDNKALMTLTASCLMQFNIAVSWLKNFQLSVLEPTYREIILQNNGHVPKVLIKRRPEEVKLIDEENIFLASRLTMQNEIRRVIFRASEYPDILPFHEWANTRIAEVIREKLAVVETEFATDSDLS